ncbi:hypothetical protein V8F20_008828 [Naviculisporaceae sp. PSN 640]
MFSNFTGNSRKTRNVNLSGQKPSNPFAKAGSTVGASRTVAIAKAERDRQQRQQSREKQEAALRIQKVWRGYRVRRDRRAAFRASLTQAYSQGEDSQWGKNGEQRRARSEYAVPLILVTFQASVVGDHVLLYRVVEDLLQTDFYIFRTGLRDWHRLGKLAHIILVALDKTVADDGSRSRASLFLEALFSIYPILPPSVTINLRSYYKVLASYYRMGGLDARTLNAIRNAAIVPVRLDNQPDERKRVAYHEFAFSFLTQPELPLSGPEAEFFASNVDMVLLSTAIVQRVSQRTERQEGELWLLAYFIALKKVRRQKEEPSIYAVALNQLLSLSSAQIRASFTAQSNNSNESKASRATLPSYISTELSSLTDRNEIMELLQQLIRHENGDQNPGFFAGYILTLMYCFPGLGDDIRMRLYLADIHTNQGSIPSVQFFWRVISQTKIFSAIVSDSDSALGILRYRNRAGNSKAAPDSDPDWHREWRTILLFLELYVFVLRLTDDDDFFSSINPSAMHGLSSSRLRSSGLSMKDIKALTLFLKHLGFVLYYNSAAILEEGGGRTREGLGDFLASPARSKNSGGATSKKYNGGETYVITSGIEYEAFRTLVTAAMKMLYERDSRRPFLPEHHWLMTSKFDMEGFLQAVVLEEQKQRAVRENDDDDTSDTSEDDDDQPLGSRLHESRQMKLEKARSDLKKAARERMLAAAGPRLEILRNMPFVVPFETRVQIFRQFIFLDKQRRRGGYIDPDQWRLSILNQHGSWHSPDGPGRDVLSRHSARIKRGQIFSDALDQFWSLEDSLKEPIQITFVDEFDIPEAGIDGGGVTKEFLTSVTKEAFTENTNLFVANSKNSFYPNSAALDQLRESLRQAGVKEGSGAWQESLTDCLRQYEFLGRIIGKCMYEGILIDIVFAGFFLLKWASAGVHDTYRANINDLHELDEELYQGMLRLKNYTGDIADLALDFTITDQVSLPGEPIRTISRNLIPNGEDIPVTNENRPLYISYVARHRLAVQPHAQTRAFLRGLSMIIDPTWLSMFNQNELQRLVGGDSSSIDVEDLRRHTIYSGVYEIGDDGQEHPTVKLFWEVMHGLTDAEKRDVLKYVTSTPRAPLLGFSQLKPAFSIRDGGLDQTRLPSASTCVNLLKLPQYRTAAVLKSKLLYAVTSGAGFDLS